MQLERGLSTRTEVPCLTALGAGCEQPEEALAHVERYSFNHIMNVFAPCDPCFALDADFTVGLAPMPNKKRLELVPKLCSWQNPFTFALPRHIRIVCIRVCKVVLKA